MELRHRQEEMERLELEQAIALSLCAEEERIRLLQLQVDSRRHVNDYGGFDAGSAAVRLRRRVRKRRGRTTSLTIRRTQGAATNPLLRPKPNLAAAAAAAAATTTTTREPS
jgi:hypothetical protein